MCFQQRRTVPLATGGKEDSVFLFCASREHLLDVHGHCAGSGARSEEGLLLCDVVRPLEVVGVFLWFLWLCVLILFYYPPLCFYFFMRQYVLA